MRLKLKFSESKIPFADSTQNAVNSCIHRILGENNKYHNSFSNYCVSSLFGGVIIDNKMTYPNGAHFYVSSLDEELIEKLQIDNLDKTNVFTFYDDMVTAIIQYNGSKEVGQEVTLSSDEIQKIMDDIKVLERKIAEIRVAIRREDNFNKKMDYNIQIKELQMEIKLLQEELK